MIEASADFIAAGGNRHPSAADWDVDSGLLAYGADRNIALWSPNDSNASGIHAILQGHDGTVNAVKFFYPKISSARLLLSGATDKTIRVWQPIQDLKTDFHEAAILTEHENPVHALAAFTPSKSSVELPFFASASADPFIRIWHLEYDVDKHVPQVTLKQRISLKPPYFALALGLTFLEESRSIVLAAAGTSSRVQLFVSSIDDIDFKLVATLTGHEGWVRSLAFMREQEDAGSDLLLASASQDKYIRLWRFHRGEELPEVSQASKDPLLGSVGKAISNRPHRFASNDVKYSVTFEALLVGHEDWVYTAQWRNESGNLRLLTSSADNSLSIWELDSSSEVWVCSVRLGEISSQKGATTATGSSGGFWIGFWSPDARAVVSLGRTGSWRLWRYEEQNDAWTQDIGITGHTREVRSLTWSKAGTYLLSTGSDQTTRLFAEWKRHDGNSWHELSRPQVHGYDLNCIDTIGNTRFISGADEKLLRVFEQPKGVAELLQNVTDIEIDELTKLPDIAQIPVMGLSNKATTNGVAEEGTSNAEEPEEQTSPVTVSLNAKRPPVEDELGRHLLWPEIEKLYGHGYEISSVAASNNGHLLATACRASSIDHAVIRIYETENWREIKTSLKAHTLTVTSLVFSPNDKYLLSVGRDRQCCVWALKDREAAAFDAYATNPKAHTRMILDASWITDENRPAFVTAGRDKSLRVWTFTDGKLEQIAQVAFDHPVTAVACLLGSPSDVTTVAAGSEDGSVFLVQITSPTSPTNPELQKLSRSLLPSKAVTSLAWRPQYGRSFPRVGILGENVEVRQLAAASEDTSVRILSIPMPKN